MSTSRTRTGEWASIPPLLLLPHHIMHIYGRRCFLFFPPSLSLSLGRPFHSRKSPARSWLRGIKSLRINSASIQLCMHGTQINGAVQRPAHTHTHTAFGPSAALVPESPSLIMKRSPECCRRLMVTQVLSAHRMKCYHLAICFFWGGGRGVKNPAGKCVYHQERRVQPRPVGDIATECFLTWSVSEGTLEK